MASLWGDIELSPGDGVADGADLPSVEPVVVGRKNIVTGEAAARG